ncbi:site-2 protease family protein [Candidatus Gottesmanbacteria bacterium]|nr:site-2 protease family protein [Candidatus Gottesmanbacteria bacterium]
MFDQLSSNPLGFIFWLIALIIAITIHEYSHAYAAEHLGDPTPRLMGRLTLNPLAHLDPLGTLMLLLIRFGWGKPVQFDPFNLRHPRRDSAIISLAGPVSNILLATTCSLLLRLTMNYEPLAMNLFFSLFLAFLQPLIIMNVVLAVFNLVPIHPLDGFKIVEGILPEEYSRQWKELEGYGMIFLLFLMFPIFGSQAPISRLISPVISFLLNILLPRVPII